MSTLYEIVNPPLAPTPTAEPQAAARWLAIAANITKAIEEGMNAIGTDCQTLGKSAVLASMPPEISATIGGVLPMMEQLWTACSPLPFPEMPDTPQ